MAYEAMNFANIQPQGNPFLRNLVPDILNIRKAQQESNMFPEKLKAQQLANAIKQVQAQYAQPMAEQGLQKETLFNNFYGRDMDSQIGLRGAQTNKMNTMT